MIKAFSLGEDFLTCDLLWQHAHAPTPSVTVTQGAWDRLAVFRQVVDRAVATGNTYYGVNTGFGFLADVPIDAHKLKELQVNLIRSHACGIGKQVSHEVARGMLWLRAHSFLRGHSGVSRGLVERLLLFLQYDLLPIIPEQGSVGASGDLAPLAHVALGILGEGSLLYKGARVSSKALHAQLGWQPYELQPKEGLSFINGTLFMSVLGALGVQEAFYLLAAATCIAGVSLSAFRGSNTPFDLRIHERRPHTGQRRVSERMQTLLSGPDAIMDSHKHCKKVQDPYSFRCIPQVHGATYDGLHYIEGVFNTELNSVTDNPLVFESGDILSGGNFHGQPLAVTLDFAAILVSELGSIAERRCEKLTNPAMSGLPACLAFEGGLNSGFMIPHVVCAALASENKILSHPSSVDSIPTSADKEDHVSMGPMAARKLRMINQNVAGILSVELLAACQGLDLLKPLTPSKGVTRIYDWVRARVPFQWQDQPLSEGIHILQSALLSGEFVQSL